MRVDTTGNIGIGVTVPSAKLEVAGTIQAGNLLAGRTPTATSWTTAPTTLTNFTDSNDATATGEGIAPANGTSIVTIDLGSVQKGMLFAYVRIRNGSAGGTTTTAIYQSDDNVNYTACSVGGSVQGTTLITMRPSCTFWGRYITFVCSADAVSTGRCTFHEAYLKQYQ